MITVHNYSERAYVVTGETKSIKDYLKQANARFNPHLSVGPGWIFSKSKQAELMARITASGKVQFEVEEFVGMLG